MLSERMLKKWRRAALIYVAIPENSDIVACLTVENITLRERILKLTQELLDQHLLKKK